MSASGANDKGGSKHNGWQRAGQQTAFPTMAAQASVATSFHPALGCEAGQRLSVNYL